MVNSTIHLKSWYQFFTNSSKKEEQGTLSKSFYKATATLTPKPDTDIMTRTRPTSLANIEENKHSLTDAVRYKKGGAPWQVWFVAGMGWPRRVGASRGIRQLRGFGPPNSHHVLRRKGEPHHFWEEKTRSSGWTCANSMGDILAETMVTVCRHVALSGWEGHSLSLFLHL